MTSEEIELLKAILAELREIKKVLESMDKSLASIDSSTNPFSD